MQIDHWYTWYANTRGRIVKKTRLLLGSVHLVTLLLLLANHYISGNFSSEVGFLLGWGVTEGWKDGKHVGQEITGGKVASKKINIMCGILSRGRMPASDGTANCTNTSTQHEN